MVFIENSGRQGYFISGGVEPWGEWVGGGVPGDGILVNAEGNREEKGVGISNQLFFVSESENLGASTSWEPRGRSWPSSVALSMFNRPGLS